MRIFVCEFITGGGVQDGELPASLVNEGDMMLSAILRDLLDAGYTDLVCTRDKRLEVPVHAIEVIAADRDIWKQWERLICESEAVCVIAPESNDILFRFTKLVEENDRTLLGCSSDIVRLAGSKNACCNWLLENGIPSSPVYTPSAILPDCKHGWVVKPDDGAGGDDVIYLDSKRKLEQFLENRDTSKLVIQEYIPGTPASISIAFDHERVIVLAFNRQYFEFSGDGRGKLTGILVNGTVDQKTDLENIARRVGNDLPGICGYVGIDLVLSDSGPVIIEINPRLTTTYAGLRQAMGRNPADFILGIAVDGKLPCDTDFSYHPVRINL